MLFLMKRKNIIKYQYFKSIRVYLGELDKKKNRILLVVRKYPMKMFSWDTLCNDILYSECHIFDRLYVLIIN